jgi:signal transduction histidine kinase
MHVFEVIGIVVMSLVVSTWAGPLWRGVYSLLMMRATLHERERVARELHDTLLQSVQGLLLIIQSAARDADSPVTRERLLRASEMTRVAVEDARMQILCLRAHLSLTDIPDRLAYVGDQLSELKGVAFSQEVSGVPFDLTPDASSELFLALREVVTNAFLHAEAREVRVRLTYSPGSFEGIVDDDGIGMDWTPRDERGQTGHWGLIGASERVERLGGTFSIRTTPGSGTTVQVAFPTQAAGRSEVGSTRGFSML